MVTMTRETPELIHDEAIANEVREQSRPQRLARAGGRLAAVGMLAAGAGAAYGVFNSSTEASIGPHEAQVELTLDGEATFDLGPIGSFIKPLDSPVGARIIIGEVPTDASEGFTRQDIEEYARTFAGFEGDIEDIKQKLQNQALRYGIFAGAGAMLLYAGLGERGRREITAGLKHSRFAQIKPAPVLLAAATLSAAAIAAPATASASENAGTPVSSVFDGTPLEGMRVTGKLLPELVNTVGKDILDRWRENDEFYDRVVGNLRQAFEESLNLRPHDDYPIMLFYTDIHCNVGMARVIGEAARLAEADIIADGGDTTMGGTAIEEFCVQVLGKELPDIDRLVAGGNHDGSITEQHLRGHDFTVLDGQTVETNGLRVLGDDDVRRSQFGVPIRQDGDETVDSFGHRLADTACADPAGVDILLVHEPDAAEQALQRGCVTTVLSGHMHRGEIQAIGLPDGTNAFHLNGDNASGATNDRPSLGPVDRKSPAALYLIKFSRQTGRAMFYQTITVHADAAVEVSNVTAVPRTMP